MGYEVLVLGVGKPQGFYPLDFGLHFSRRQGKDYRPGPNYRQHSPAGKKARLSKLELSLQLLQQASKKGIRAA